jgi:hypothetical protein
VFKGLCNPARRGGNKLSLKIRYRRWRLRRPQTGEASVEVPPAVAKARPRGWPRRCGLLLRVRAASEACRSKCMVVRKLAETVFCNLMVSDRIPGGFMPDWIVTLFIAVSSLLYLFSKLQRERKGLPSTEVRVKIPLSWGIASFAVLFIFVLANMLFCYLHGVPVPDAFWFFLVVLAAAILICCVILIRRKGPEYIPPEEKRRGTRLVALTGMLIVVMPVLGFSIRALQRKFGF